MKNISIRSIVQAEFHKLQRSFAFWIILFYPLLLGCLYTLRLAFSDLHAEHPWYQIMINFLYLYMLCSPVVIALFVYQYTDMEERGRKYRQFFTLPLHPLHVYVSKLGTILSVVTVSGLVAYCSYLLSAKVISIFHPQLAFVEYDFRLINAAFFFKLGVLSLSVAAAQFALNLLYPKAIVAVGVASFMPLLGVVTSKSSSVVYNPYASILPFMDYRIESTTFFTPHIGWSLLYLVVLLPLGYWLFTRKRAV